MIVIVSKFMGFDYEVINGMDGAFTICLYREFFNERSVPLDEMVVGDSFKCWRNVRYSR